MRTSKRLIWIAPSIAAGIMALALAGYFVVVVSAAPATVTCPLHQGSARYIAQPTPTSPSATASADFVPNQLIEQYKAYVTDLGSLGAQIAPTQTFYLTIVSALIAVLAFKEPLRPMREYFAPASIVIFIFILLVCITWFFTALQFQNLLAAKFEVLRAMEQKYLGLYPMFCEQTQHYEANRAYGVIRHQSILIVVIGLGALFIATAGICWQIHNRIASKGAELTPEHAPQTTPDYPVD
jgi:hypothetical protein